MKKVLAIVIGAQITRRFVQHQVAGCRGRNDFAIQPYAVFNGYMLGGLAGGFAVYRDCTAANRTLYLRARKVAAVANEFIQSHGGNTQRCAPIFFSPESTV